MFSICLYKFFVIYKKIIPVILRDASHQIPITKIRGSLKIKGEMKNSKQETSLCTFIDASERKRECARRKMHAHRRAEMFHRFLTEGIACHETWSALRNADGIRTRVAKGKGKPMMLKRDAWKEIL